MKVVGDYREQGYAHIKALIEPEVAKGLVHSGRGSPSTAPNIRRSSSSSRA